MVIYFFSSCIDKAGGSGQLVMQISADSPGEVRTRHWMVPRTQHRRCRANIAPAAGMIREEEEECCFQSEFYIYKLIEHKISYLF